MTAPPRNVSVIAGDKHRAMHARMTRFLQEIAGEMSAPELLALAAHLVGQLVALQDQRTMTPEAALELVAQNIDLGNQAQIAELATKTSGRA